MANNYFFATATELRKYVPVTEAFTFVEIEPFLESNSIKYLRNDLGIGKELFDQIFTAYNAPGGYDALTAINQNLVHKIRAVVAKFAFHGFISFGVVNIGKEGINNIKNENRELIRKWQKDDLQKQFLIEAFIGLDLLLEFLEENKASFATWSASNAYTFTKNQFINSVFEFAQYYSLVRGRRTFLALKPIIVQVEELEVREVLGETLYNTIKAEILSGVIAPANQDHLKLIRPAVANLVMEKAFDQLAISIDDSGIQVFSQKSNQENSLESQTISEIKLQRLKEVARNSGVTYLNKLRKSLESGFTDQSGSRKNDLDSRSYYV